MKIRLSVMYMFITVICIMVYGVLSFLGFNVTHVNAVYMFLLPLAVMIILAVHILENMVLKNAVKLDFMMSKSSREKEVKKELPDDKYDVPPIPPPINEPFKIETTLDKKDEKAEAIATYILEKVKAGLDLSTIYQALIQSQYEGNYIQGIMNQMINQKLIELPKKEEPQQPPPADIAEELDKDIEEEEKPKPRGKKNKNETNNKPKK